MDLIEITTIAHRRDKATNSIVREGIVNSKSMVDRLYGVDGRDERLQPGSGELEIVKPGETLNFLRIQGTYADTDDEKGTVAGDPARIQICIGTQWFLSETYELTNSSDHGGVKIKNDDPTAPTVVANIVSAIGA